jgi:integrase
VPPTIAAVPPTIAAVPPAIANATACPPEARRFPPRLEGYARSTRLAAFEGGGADTLTPHPGDGRVGSRKRGTRPTVSRGGYPTRKAAEAALAEVVAANARGDDRPLMARCDQTLGEHLDEWLAACQVRARRPLKATTAEGYGVAIRCWITPYLGDVPLADLTPGDLTGLYRTLATKGGRSLNRAAMRPLGTRSVQLAHVILTKALHAAVTSGKIAASPVDRIPADDRPTHTPAKLTDRHWSPDEARAFLAATADTRLHPLWALALDTGARRGELAALRWSDVDLDDGAVSIARSRVMVGAEVRETTPKSAKSERRVDLHPATVAVLRRWRKAQAAERLAAGPAWEGGDDPYLWTDEAGTPYRPDLLAARFGEAQPDAAEVITFHGLRHTSATIALAAGVPVHVVSQRLGHATVSITLDVYAHALPEQATDAAARIGQALYGP